MAPGLPPSLRSHRIRVVVRWCGVLMLWAAGMACADGAPAPAAGKSKDPAPNSSASCLECHSDPKLTMKKAGQVRPLFVSEATFAKSVHRTLDCTDCHEGFDAESIPHQKPISARSIATAASPSIQTRAQ